jgi:hypothetical protein
MTSVPDRSALVSFLGHWNIADKSFLFWNSGRLELTPRVQITPPTAIAEGMTANQVCVTVQTCSMGCMHSKTSDACRVYHAVPRRPLVFCETVSRGVGSAKLRPTGLSAAEDVRGIDYSKPPL